MKRAHGEPVPSLEVRHGRLAGPGDYSTANGTEVGVKDPSRQHSQFRSHVNPEIRGIPYNKDVALVYHTPSRLADHTSKVPPNAYDLAAHELKTVVNARVNAGGASSNFDSECMRFDENQSRVNYRYSVAQENPSPRFSMKRERGVWCGNHPTSRDIRGPVVPKEERPDLWANAGEGADSFYQPKRSLAQEMRAKARKHNGKSVGVSYDSSEMAHRYPVSVVRSKKKQSDTGPGDYNPEEVRSS